MSSTKESGHGGGLTSCGPSPTIPPPDIDSLLVWYDSAEVLQAAWAQDLVRGALFVPTSAEHAPGDLVRVVIELPFCERSLDLRGAVVSALPVGVEESGQTPGIAVQTDRSLMELRLELEALTGISLPEAIETVVAEPASGQPPAPDTLVEVEANGRRFEARSADLSYNGLLALLPGIDLGEGCAVSITLVHPRRNDEITIEGRVERQTRCDGGLMAASIHFSYGLDRVDEVTGFIDSLRGHLRARNLASVTGSLEKTGLEDVLATFSSVASHGTLILYDEEHQGKIAYCDGEIVCATAGLVSGTKALGRMFTWTKATFEFRAELDIDEDTTPMPLESAILTAAVARDEVSRLDLGKILEEGIYEFDAERYAEVESALSRIEREVAKNAELGFPIEALLDIIPENDANIYLAVASLVDVGVMVERAR